MCHELYFSLNRRTIFHFSKYYCFRLINSIVSTTMITAKRLCVCEKESERRKSSSHFLITHTHSHSNAQCQLLLSFISCCIVMSMVAQPFCWSSHMNPICYVQVHHPARRDYLRPPTHHRTEAAKFIRIRNEPYHTTSTSFCCFSFRWYSNLLTIAYTSYTDTNTKANMRFSYQSPTNMNSIWTCYWSVAIFFVSKSTLNRWNVYAWSTETKS